MIQHTLTWIKGVVLFLRPVHIIAAVGLVVFLWFLIMGDQGLYRLGQLTQMRTSLTNERHTLSGEIESKEREKRLLEDPKNLEMIIRKELGYIKPGEMVFEEEQKK